MEKEQVVAALKELADLLEITGANKFEYIAIRSGAQGLDDWQGDLASAVDHDDTGDAPNEILNRWVK